MSNIDHLTDEDLKSMTDKIEMLTEQLELSKAETEVCLELLGDNRPDFDTLRDKARKKVSAKIEQKEDESHPPIIETFLD